LTPIATKRICPTGNHQSGASLIAAIFLMTGLAVLGAAMTRMMVISSNETINEWRSAQAFYAAESGVEWAIWDLTKNSGDGLATNRVITTDSWCDTSVTATTVGGQTLYRIIATGKSGGGATNPVAERRLTITFMP